MKTEINTYKLDFCLLGTFKLLMVSYMLLRSFICVTVLHDILLLIFESKKSVIISFHCAKETSNRKLQPKGTKKNLVLVKRAIK